MMSPSDVTVSQFRTFDEFTGFECENQECSNFVKSPDGAQKYRLQNLGVTYVFRAEETPIGFVTMVTGSLRKEDSAADGRTEKFSGAVPCVLLEYVARDVRYKGKGVGKIMLDWAINLTHELSEKVGCRFVVVEIPQHLITVFQSYGFELIPPDRLNRHYVMFFDLGILSNLD